MKNHLLISLVFFFWILHLPTWSQMQLPQKSTVQHNDASRPCIRAIVHPEPKPLKKAWKDYLKETHDFKIRGIGFLSNKDLLSAEKVVVERISKKRNGFLH